MASKACVVNDIFDPGQDFMYGIALKMNAANIYRKMMKTLVNQQVQHLL
ncbi:hypothetical protein KIS1582_4179 [Cytobacillus firmus]|uniref:Uncharacterized protein n=1 Tax=Cytobacillus firmus TaxID=1399 RepID=A0A800MT82_CYTFI|nr:hypothetical protein KIS1582_4179 [Cytobacillus firmus]